MTKPEAFPKRPRTKQWDLHRPAGLRLPRKAFACMVFAALAVMLSGCDGPEDPPSPSTRQAGDRSAGTPRGGAAATSRAATSTAPAWTAGGPMTIDTLRAEALGVCTQAMADLPKSTDPLILMGKCHHQLGNRAEALRWLGRARDRSPRRADVYLSMGMVAAENGDFINAADLYGKARHLSPTMAGVNKRLGEAFLELGEPRKAITALQKELAYHPRTASPHIALGRAYLQLEQYDKAAESYAKAVEKVPEGSGGYYGLATAYAKLGQADQARKYRLKFTEIRARMDEVVRARRGTAGDLARMRRLASLMHSDVAKFVYARHGRGDQAERHFTRACELDLESRSARQRLLDFYMQQKRPAEAAVICKQLTELAPDNAAYHLNAGVIFGGLKRLDEAEKALRRGIELAPDEPRGYRSLAFILMRDARDPAGARANAEKLVELEPTGENYYLLCLACEKNGDLNRAREAIARARKLIGQNATVRRVYDRLHAPDDGKQPRENR